MFLAAYHFDGDPDGLLTAYRSLVASFPVSALELHVCVAGPSGLTVYDGCPSREVFEEFSRSTELAGAVAAAGLPTPHVRPLGEICNLVVAGP